MKNETQDKFKADSKGNFIEMMDLPAKPETKAESKAWPNRQDFADRLTHTRQPNVLLRVPGVLSSIPRVQRITPLYLSGDAGTGKGYTARAIAKALGFRLIETLPSQLESTMAENFSISKRNPPTLLFIDESHAKEEGKGDTLLLKLTDTSDSPVYEGGDGENLWAYDQRENLLIMASNRGEPNPALVGEKGRMAEIAMLPFKGEDLAWFIAENMRRVEHECNVTFTSTVAPFLVSMTSGIARNVEDLVNAIGQVYADTAITAEMVRTVAMQLCGPDGKPLLCPLGMSGRLVGMLQFLAEKGVLRENALKGKLGEESGVFATIKRQLTSQDLMEACSGGFRLTRQGFALVERIDDTLCNPIPEPTVPVPVVVKAPAKAKGKGGKK